MGLLPTQTPFLPVAKREYLLKGKIITVFPIKSADLRKFQKPVVLTPF
jgi:hypothetical protein